MTLQEFVPVLLHDNLQTLESFSLCCKVKRTRHHHATTRVGVFILTRCSVDVGVVKEVTKDRRRSRRICRLSDIISISNTSLFQSACFLWKVLGLGDGLLNLSFYYRMMIENGWGGYSRNKRTNEATNAYN